MFHEASSCRVHMVLLDVILLLANIATDGTLTTERHWETEPARSSGIK